MKGESYTEKADVFSYGMVCWEILTGEHPYAEYPISTDKFVSKFEEAIVGKYTQSTIRHHDCAQLHATLPTITNFFNSWIATNDS